MAHYKKRKPGVFQGQTVEIRFTIRNQDGIIIDLSDPGYTTTIVLKRAGSTKTTYDSEFQTDGSDGKVFYRTVPADLDKAGPWKAQCIVTVGTDEYPTNVANFTVSPRI